MMEQLKNLATDSDGMATYEYIVNHIDTCSDDMVFLVDNLKRVDLTGQFLASSARFLAAIDRNRFYDLISILVEGAIERDRERKYITSLPDAIWGPDYRDHVDELRAEDDVFRRLYKRIYPVGAM